MSNSNNNCLVERITLDLSCENLASDSSKIKVNSYVIMETREVPQTIIHPLVSWAEFTRTEIKFANCSPVYSGLPDHPFLIDYHFQKRQEIRFRIIDDGAPEGDNELGVIQTALAALLAADKGVWGPTRFPGRMRGEL